VTYNTAGGDLVDNADGTWSLTIPAANGLAEAVYDVAVTVTDAATNSTADATVDELQIDLTPPLAPTPVLSDDANNDGLLSTAEAVNPQAVAIALPPGVMAGDVVTLDDGTTVTTIALTAADIAASWVAANAVLPADGSTLTVSAVLTDQAGNVSPAGTDVAVVDMTAPDSPTVVITEDSDDDVLISIAESNADVDVAITLPASAVAGDTLTIVLDGVLSTQVLSAADIAAGVINVTTTTPADGGSVLAEAYLTDPSGNQSIAVDDTAVLDLTAPVAPTVTNLITNIGTPVLVGTAMVNTGDVLTVTVNGVTYNAANADLTDNGDGTWALTIPAADALTEGVYEVNVWLQDPAGNATSDTTFDELIVDFTPPPAPGVISLSTPDTTPLISGTTTVGSGLTLTVTVNGVMYTVGDGNLTDNGDGTWDLIIPLANAMVDGVYQVVATLTDVAGNPASDLSIDDLLIDTLAPLAPGVASLITNITAPTITGTASIAAGEILTVAVNGVVYTAGDGNLFDNGDGTWQLNIPAENALPEASYDVVAVVTDLAGNVSVDPSSNELVIDTTAPMAPSVVNQSVFRCRS